LVQLLPVTRHKHYYALLLRRGGIVVMGLCLCMRMRWTMIGRTYCR
jgi:hypothetical protein